MEQDQKDLDSPQPKKKKKKVGRPKGSKSNYNYHSKTKAKISARRSVKAKEKRIAKLKKQINSQKSTLKTQKKVLKKLDNKKTDNQVVSNTDLDSLPPIVQRQIEQDNVVFHPNKGPQTEFLLHQSVMFFMEELQEVVNPTQCWLIRCAMLIKKRIER